MDDDTWTADFGELDSAAPEWAAKRPRAHRGARRLQRRRRKGRLETGADLARRKLVPVEFDNLEDTLGAPRPAASRCRSAKAATASRSSSPTSTAFTPMRCIATCPCSLRSPTCASA